MDFQEKSSTSFDTDKALVLKPKVGNSGRSHAYYRALQLITIEFHIEFDHLNSYFDPSSSKVAFGQC